LTRNVCNRIPRDRVMVANILTPRGPSLSLFPARAATVHIYAAKHPGCSRHGKELARLVAELPADARISLDRTSRLVAGLVRADLTRGKNETCGAPGLISPTFRAIHKKAKLSHVGDQDGNYTDDTCGQSNNAKSVNSSYRTKNAWHWRRRFSLWILRIRHPREL